MTLTGKEVRPVSASSVYESLVKPHLNDLKSYCFYLTRSKWDGEDLYQEALLRSMAYFLNKEPTKDLKPFMIRVARNLWIDSRRSAQRQRKALQHPLAVSWTDANYADVRSLLEWIGERLPARNIEMLLLAEYFGYSMQEVAELTGSTVPAVKSVLHRTRRMLRCCEAMPERSTEEPRVVTFDVDRWSKAVMRHLPPCL